ncbi:hypothetical protein PRUPE_2G169300 [Prunus persica]|uniref:Uncharacterized protein n=1 Tax=Prunus persica TaxID=3760 RepID=A0A251QH14_PRUPE|nr:hypothetical protein PRUPE_2G169300 [Prunus persica]
MKTLQPLQLIKSSTTFVFIPMQWGRVAACWDKVFFVQSYWINIIRCYFACEVLDGKIYSIGGLGSNSSDPHSWDIYDPCTNSWKFHADPNIVPEIEDSVVMDGKIYIRCGT